MEDCADKYEMSGKQTSPTWTYSPWESDESLWLKDKEQKRMSGDGIMEDIDADCIARMPTVRQTKTYLIYSISELHIFKCIS